MQPISLAARAVETPETLATLGEAEIRSIMGTLTMVNAAAHAKWLTVLEAEKAANQIAPGDRLLGTKEICKRIGCSMTTLMRGWKAGRYTFLLKDGGRLMGSEDGLTRWIAARVKRQSRS